VRGADLPLKLGVLIDASSSQRSADFSAGAVIFTIDTDLSGMSYGGPRIMERLAEVTGGESFNQVGIKEVPKAFASIREMIESMYYLTYVPPDASKGPVHEVEVQRTPKGKFKLSYARKYFWEQ